MSQNLVDFQKTFLECGYLIMGWEWKYSILYHVILTFLCCFSIPQANRYPLFKTFWKILNSHGKQWIFGYPNYGLRIKIFHFISQICDVFIFFFSIFHRKCSLNFPRSIWMFTIVGYVVRSPIFFFLIGDLMKLDWDQLLFCHWSHCKKGLKFSS